jgi:hypothetical protein
VGSDDDATNSRRPARGRLSRRRTRPNVTPLRNRAFVVKVNRLFRP